jgi:hypothetical protein
MNLVGILSKALGHSLISNVIDGSHCEHLYLGPMATQTLAKEKSHPVREILRQQTNKSSTVTSMTLLLVF